MLILIRENKKIRNNMARFIRLSKEKNTYLNLDVVAYVNVPEKTVWTTEPSSKGGQCKYVFKDNPRIDESAFDLVLEYLYANLKPSEGEL